MGGCLDKPKMKKSKVLPGTIRLPQPNKPPANRMSIQQDIIKVEQVKPKHKKMSINQLLTTYRIEYTLLMCSKMQGPKYLSNLVDGSSKVLRVINLQEINQKRLEIYKKILGLETFQNQEGSIMILDEYCAGEDIYQIIEKANENKETSQVLFEFFSQIVKIINEFHKNKVWLGNLSLSSFRRKSIFEDQVRLVDINLHNQVGDHQRMGFAHKDSYQADFQFIGYLLQFMACDQPPIFIPHKLQYVEFQSIPYSALIHKLLKGTSITPDQILTIKQQSIIINARVGCGYKFRRDLNKLLKMRKKRRAHSKFFYGQDIKEMVNEHRFQEDSIYRYEAERIFERIKGYLEQIKSIHEQSFLNYAGNNQSIKKLKEVFLLTDKDKKLAELKECLSTIK